jgi:acetyltransferase-like isoleucine patch superfamily enzyme
VYHVQGNSTDSPYKSPDFMRCFARVGEGVQIFKWALIIHPEVIQIGDGTRIDDYSRIEGGKGLHIGKYVHIASFVGVGLGGGEADIGDYCGIAQGARVINGGGHPFENIFPTTLPLDDVYHIKRGRTVLERFSFVAANAVVLPNVTIGEGAVVAAGAVATKDVAPWTIVAGNPAHVIGKRAKFA